MTNESLAQAVELFSLQDDIYGDLDGQGSCSKQQLLQPGVTYSCAFSGAVNGPPLGFHRNVVTAAGFAFVRERRRSQLNPTPISDQDSAIVLLFGLTAPAAPIPTMGKTFLLAMGVLMMWVAWRRRTRK